MSMFDVFFFPLTMALLPFTPFLFIFCLLHTFKRFQAEDKSYLWMLLLTGIFLILTLFGVDAWIYYKL